LHVQDLEVACKLCKILYVFQILFTFFHAKQAFSAYFAGLPLEFWNKFDFLSVRNSVE